MTHVETLDTIIRARLGNISLANGYHFDVEKITNSQFAGPYQPNQKLHIFYGQIGLSVEPADYGVERHSALWGVQAVLTASPRDGGIQAPAFADADIRTALARSTATPGWDDEPAIHFGGETPPLSVSRVSIGDSTYSQSGNIFFVDVEMRITYDALSGDMEDMV
jgi:hypothetical protein